MSQRSQALDPAAVSTEDAVLAVIAASLLAALVGAVAFPVSVGTALALGSVPASGSIGYALFLDPPGADGE